METVPVPTADSAQVSVLAGFNVLLMGPAGTGKTHSIGTLVDSGMEVFYLGLEPGLESLLGYYTDRKQTIPGNLHWHTLKAPSASFAELIDSAEKINTLTLESIAKMQDPRRSKHNQFIELLKVLNNFKDDRTGKTFGGVDTWPAHYCLVVDGMTGLNRAAMSLVIGGKPVKSQSDWGIAQDQVEKILRQLCDNCTASLVVLAHVEREVDQVLGGVKLMVASLGKALAPKIPPMFSDVIMSVRSGTKWSWDTANSQVDLKTRNLPIQSDLPPNFGLIVDKWKTRGGVIPTNLSNTN